MYWTRNSSRAWYGWYARVEGQAGVPVGHARCAASFAGGAVATRTANALGCGGRSSGTVGQKAAQGVGRRRRCSWTFCSDSIPTRPARHRRGGDLGVVPQGAPPTRAHFPTFTADLKALATGSRPAASDGGDGVHGVYWIPIYELLEERAFSVSGQCTSSQECAGQKDGCPGLPVDPAVAHLWAVACFVSPRQDMCAVRAYVRHRDNLIRYRSAHVCTCKRRWPR